MLGERIKLIRLALKESQTDFAMHINITQGFLSAVERGEKTPGADVLIALKSYTNCNGEYLLSGEGAMFIERSDEETTESETLSELVAWFNREKTSVGKGTLHTLGTTLVREPEDIYGRNKPAQQTVKLETLDPRKSNVTEVRGVVDHLKTEREMEQLRQENTELKARLDQMEKMFALFVKTGQTTKQPTPETKEAVPV